VKLAGGHPGSGQVSLPAFAAAALAFFVVSNLLVETGAGAGRAPRTGPGPGPPGGRPAGLGVGHAAGHGPGGRRGRPDQPGLVPGLALPTAAVYLACRGAIRADRERARAEAAAEQALIRQLQESDRLKRDLLATVSHELKTPLTVILGTLGTLSRRGAALDPAERREFVDMAVRQGTRLKELIEQLLLAARFEQTGQEPAARPLVAAARLAHPSASWSCTPARPCRCGRPPRPSSRCWATCSTTRPSTPPTGARCGWR
jgi:signal transduction histidine kinase